MDPKTLRVLVPIDGSDNSRRALDHAIALVGGSAAGEIDILNVQPPVSGDVATFVGNTNVKEYHRAEGEKVLAAARRRLEKAGVAFHHHVCVGQPGPVIAEFAQESKCDQIVMGTRGMGSALGRLLGSTAAKVVELTKIPVTLVK